MRIAYLCADPGVPFGGVKGSSIHVVEMVRALAAEGAEVLVIVAALGLDAVEPPPDVSVEVVGPGRGASAAERISRQDELVDALVARLRAFGADALYERLALHAVAGTLAARRLRIPHLVELNAPLIDEATRYRRLDEPEAAHAFERETLTGADLVLAVSPPLAEHARAHGARRVEVLQNAVAIDRFPERPGVDGIEPAAVFVGNARPWHGVEVIERAWRLLGSGAPRLDVVGDGPGVERLRSIGARIHGTVPPERVPELLIRAEIGLAPYRADAPRYFSPIKLFEYLAAGLAAIVADLPAVTEVVDADTAVVIPSGDADALAGATAALLADGDRRRALGTRGRTLVAAEHTWGHRARRILEAVAELDGSKVATA